MDALRALHRACRRGTVKGFTDPLEPWHAVVPERRAQLDAEVARERPPGHVLAFNDTTKMIEPPFAELSVAIDFIAHALDVGDHRALADACIAREPDVPGLPTRPVSWGICTWTSSAKAPVGDLRTSGCAGDGTTDASSKLCPCGSGKNFEDCHGKGGADAEPAHVQTIEMMIPFGGVPGQTQNYIVTVNGSLPQGAPGKYRVVFTLSRDEHLPTPRTTVSCRLVAAMRGIARWLVDANAACVPGARRRGPCSSSRIGIPCAVIRERARSTMSAVLGSIPGT